MSAAADDQLLFESRVGMRQALVAGGAAVFVLASSVVQLTGPHATVNELTLGLITEHKRFPLDLIGALVEAVGWLGVAFTLNYLYRATKARNPLLKPWVQLVAVIGTVAAAITGVAYAVVIAIKAHDFVTTCCQTYTQANHLTSGGALIGLQLLGQAALLIAAIAFCMVALNAMRVGLLTRFMGYLGIFAGVLVLFAITPVPVVEVYWLGALAVLFSGRWPTGTPPSWRSGRAEPWPSTQSMRDQRVAKAAEARGNGKPPKASKPSRPTPAPRQVEPSSSAPSPSTSKRKRKRRK